MRELRKQISNAVTDQDAIWADGIKEAVEEAKESGELDLVFLTTVAKKTSENRAVIEKLFLDFEARCREKRKVHQIFE